MKIKKLEGLIAPVFTPLKENGELCLKKIADYATDLKKEKLSGAFILGSSGEGMLLSTRERKAVVEEWSRFESDDFKLMVHVGDTSYQEAQELALHARENNVFAISSMGPVFLQPKRVEELVEYCHQIASVVPELPFYYYHIPVRTGIQISMLDFLKIGSQRIPNLAGLKYTHSNLMEMQQCLAFADGKFDIVHGSDATLLCGLVIGVKGAIGTTYNFMPHVYYKIIDAFNAGNISEARTYQMLSVQINDIIARYGGGIVAGKAMEKLAGIDCGPCRIPLKNLSETEITLMKEELEATGFFDILSTR